VFRRVVLPLAETALGLTRPVVGWLLNRFLDVLDRLFGHR
jgi:hypothetical protein